MNPGVAIVGFILCFVTGAGLMRGYDVHSGAGQHVGAAGAFAHAREPVADQKGLAALTGFLE